MGDQLDGELRLVLEPAFCALRVFRLDPPSGNVLANHHHPRIGLVFVIAEEPGSAAEPPVKEPGAQALAVVCQGIQRIRGSEAVTRAVGSDLDGIPKHELSRALDNLSARQREQSVAPQRGKHNRGVVSGIRSSAQCVAYEPSSKL